MKKITIISMILGLFSLGAYAQQDAGFSMYFFNPVYINSAYAGSREVFSGTLVNRSQWTAMSGAPTTQALTIHSAIPDSRSGLGLQLYNDKVGPMKNTGINLTYAYHLPLNDNTKLSFGITGMLNNVRIGLDDINIEDKNDNAFGGNASSSYVPDASAGLYLYKTRFYLGLSSTHLMQSKFGSTSSTDPNMAKFYRQLYLTSGIVLPVSKSVDFRPSILVKYIKAAPAMGEIDGSFIFFQKLFLGAGFRSSKRINLEGTDNMVIGIIQLEIARILTLGYSYDYYLDRSGSYNSGGTHEFMLGWDIGNTKTKMSNPRFF